MISLNSVKRLVQARVECRLIELEDRAYTVSDVVKFSRGALKIDEICKTIIMKDSEGFYAVLLLGANRINFRKLKDLRNNNPRIAKGSEVTQVTGIEPGAICPILLEIPLIIDPEVFTKNKINFGSGHHLYGLEMDPKDLSKVVNYVIWKVT